MSDIRPASGQASTACFPLEWLALSLLLVPLLHNELPVFQDTHSQGVLHVRAQPWHNFFLLQLSLVLSFSLQSPLPKVCGQGGHGKEPHQQLAPSAFPGTLHLKRVCLWNVTAPLQTVLGCHSGKIPGRMGGGPLGAGNLCSKQWELARVRVPWAQGSDATWRGTSHRTSLSTWPCRLERPSSIWSATSLPKFCACGFRLRVSVPVEQALPTVQSLQVKIL